MLANHKNDFKGNKDDLINKVDQLFNERLINITKDINNIKCNLQIEANKQLGKFKINNKKKPQTAVIGEKTIPIEEVKKINLVGERLGSIT